MKNAWQVMIPVALIAAASPGPSDAQQSTRTSVRGTVTSAGKPARSVWVIISQDGREKGRSLTGDDGKYYIANLDPGTYDFVVEGGGQAQKRRATLPVANGTFDISY